jgi:hypothetical protein
MARKPVVEVQCDRCPRVEYREDAGAEERDPEISIEARGRSIAHFQDLCGPCAKAVAVHVDAIAKKLDQISPDRQK